MKIESLDLSQEKQILMAIIVNDHVCGRICSKHSPGMFSNDWSNLITNWCVRYFEKYKKAPKGQIQSIFQKWSKKTRNKATIELIDKFLSTLNSDYESLNEDINPDYLLDQASDYFKLVAVKKLNESIEDCIAENDLDGIDKAFALYKPVDLTVEASTSVLEDEQAIQEAFATADKPLIAFPGALGDFYDNQFRRDAFISFLGPEKRGKSHFLVDVAVRSALQRNKTVFFTAGDMSKAQAMKRFVTRFCGQPLKFLNYQKPVAIVRTKKGIEVKKQEIRFESKLSWQHAYQTMQKLIRTKIRSKDVFLRLSCHTAGNLTVSKIESVLAQWERNDGWVPDVIVIDYADIMDAPGKDPMEKIDNLWRALRALSQERRCLVVTATQANRAAYSAKWLTMDNFSDSKKKIAHVTGMIGLNQEPAEKRKGIYRLNWIALREPENEPDRPVIVAGSLSISRPCIKSKFF